MSHLTFRRQYSDDPVPAPVVTCDSDSCVVEQHHRDEVDITTMLARFGVGADQRLPVVTISNIIKDVSLLPETLQEAYDILEVARVQFGQLPAGVRAHFQNDPRRFALATEDDLLAAGIPGVPTPAEKPVPDPSVQEGDDS